MTLSLNNLSNVQRGSQRDKAILEAIAICHVLDTDQITELFFGFPSGKRKCQSRMKVLVDKKLVKKVRLSLDTSTIYYLKKLPGNVQHALALSWVYVWFKKHRHGEKLLTWELEEKFGNIVQVDALCAVEIQLTKELRYYCVELDRGANHSRFDKVEKYNELYSLEGVAGSPMLQRLGNPSRFPGIIIVTDNVRRGLRIRALVKGSNTKLKFSVHLLSAVKEGSVLV